MVRTIHYCHLCDYKSDRRYDRDKHIQRKHASKSYSTLAAYGRAPTVVSVGADYAKGPTNMSVPPLQRTDQRGGGIIKC